MITLASGLSYFDLHFLGVPRIIATVADVEIKTLPCRINLTQKGAAASSPGVWRLWTPVVKRR